MDETLFYVVGGALVVLALLVSFAGMRNEDTFPSPRALRGLLAIFVLLVISTAAGAVMLARAEQEHRREELSHLAEEAAAEGEVANEEGASQSVEGEAAGGGGVTPPDDADGETLFVEAGCGDCHSLGAAGSAGAIGPNLDEVLVDRDVGFIERSITEPSGDIAEGFGDGIMPSTYGQELTTAEIESLAAYVHESVAAFSE